MARRLLSAAPWWLVALTAGCAPVPLADVPVRGGSPELRALLEAELQAMDRWLGPGRVSLTSVRIVPTVRGNPSAAGAYRGRRIDIHADAGAPTVVLRHELCHALDDQEGLLDEPEPLFDDLAHELFTVRQTESAERFVTARSQRSEAFAEMCEIGPLAAHALTHPCAFDAPVAADMGAWLLDHAYVAYEPAPVLLGDGDPVVLRSATPSRPQVAPTQDPTVVQVSSAGAPGEWESVDVYTGDVSDSEPAVAAQASLMALPPARGVLVWRFAGLEDGPAAVQGRIGLNHLRTGQRTLAYDPARADYQLLDDDCEVPLDDGVFVADGQVWRQWTDADVLSWAPILDVR